MNTNENKLSNDVVLYDLPTRNIKISRFFEVAKFLTDNNLWGEVEKKLITAELIGDRIILDSLLGNAVKLVLSENSSGFLNQPGHIVPVTVMCGSPSPRRPGNPGGIRGET
jgi:hypothetical protein